MKTENEPKLNRVILSEVEGEIYTKRFHISVDKAQEIIDNNNIQNRNICWRAVIRYAKAIVEGDWAQTGDSIKFDTNERLVDGQHRLLGIIRAGIGIDMSVTYNVPPSAFMFIDTGKIRAAKDILSIEGEKNAKDLPAVLNIVGNYFSGAMESKNKYTNLATIELLEEHPGVNRSINKIKRVSGFIPSSIIWACHYIFSLRDEVLADEFLEKVIMGIGLDKTSPWYILRQKLVDLTSSKAKTSRVVLMALCIKAWNAVRLGKPMRQLKWVNYGATREQFPEAI